MSDSKRYVLDANVFIEAHQSYYRNGICPAFWLALARQHETKRIVSIDKVKAELLLGNDWLSEWAKDKAPRTFFKQTADKKVSDAFADMMRWVQDDDQFTPEAKSQFASVADGWVVAYARANGLAVATHEEYAPDAKKRVPMPNVCLEFDVRYCNTFEMLSELKVQFILKKRRTRK
jgi:hypothetical protein